jgi:hypothetical protein
LSRGKLCFKLGGKPVVNAHTWMIHSQISLQVSLGFSSWNHKNSILMMQGGKTVDNKHPRSSTLERLRWSVWSKTEEWMAAGERPLSQLDVSTARWPYWVEIWFSSWRRLLSTIKYTFYFVCYKLEKIIVDNEFITMDGSQDVADTFAVKCNHN